MTEFNKKEWYNYLKNENIPWQCIDAELRGLIWLLNKIPGIKTHFCCTGHNEDNMYIRLSSTLNLNELYDLFKIILHDPNPDEYWYLMDINLDLFNSTHEDHRFELISKTNNITETINHILNLENNIMQYMADNNMNIVDVYNLCIDDRFFAPHQFNFCGRMYDIYNIKEDTNVVCSEN